MTKVLYKGCTITEIRIGDRSYFEVTLADGTKVQGLHARLRDAKTWITRRAA